jgi:diaminohydroxyphosphoribosylaminopyrimidine deaminase / 5-amino-6-(5-phosphoribosylamino)uracil reductase
MRRALLLAERGRGRVAPNPMVGACVVREGRVVGEGWHREYGLPHAEVEALAAAGDLARGSTMYVTLEPCAHHGKTPPCTDAVLRAGIARLVYAVADPNPKARGGAEVLRDAGVRVEGGVEEAEGRDLNAAFLHAHSETGALRPWIELKLALSLDARVADRLGRSAWLTGEAARAEVHRLRAGHDAILVGIGTALADDPLLTVRGPLQPRVPPVRVVLDPRLRLPPGCRLLATAAEAPVWVVGSAAAPPGAARALEAAGATVLLADDLPAAMRVLRERGVRSVFCEGGAALAGSLLAAALVDRLTLFYAPLFLGVEGRDPFAALAGDPIEATTRWRRLRTEAFGADTLISLSP